MDVFRGRRQHERDPHRPTSHPLIHTHPVPGRLQRCSGPTGNALQKIVAKSVRLPNVFDPETMSFSSKSFAASEEGMRTAAQGIYRSLLPGMKPQGRR